ncbi:branched-chain amino acid ABC transporter permease [Nitriliruptoraceae bacterium ZYF776]|nr:branched-chain amino acid ABC transporter permease [Profundirhabdus halotolerans]
MLLLTIAAGLSLLFGMMQMLNLAHGSLLLLGSYIGLAIAPTGERFLTAVAVAAVVGALAGVGLGIISRPVIPRGYFAQVLLTLGIAFIAGSVFQTVWGRDIHSLQPPPVLGGSVSIVGQPYPLYRIVVVGVGLALAIAIYLAFERTTLGAVVRAAVEDRSMVGALGINVNVVYLGVFALAAAIATVGGVVGGPILGVRPGLDFQLLVLALIVVVIGGLGSLKGAFFGALLVGQVQSLGPMLMPAFSAFLLFVSMAVVLLLRPAGLFGKAET